MTNSQKCLASLQEAFLNCDIVEVEGNPNILGQYMFKVDGNVVRVTPDEPSIVDEEQPYHTDLYDPQP